MNTVQKMACKCSTKQDKVATTEEVPGSIVIYIEEEINTFHRDVKLSVLVLRHFISFSFASKRGKRCKLFSFSSKRFGNLKEDFKDKRL